MPVAVIFILQMLFTASPSLLARLPCYLSAMTQVRPPYVAPERDIWWRHKRSQFLSRWPCGGAPTYDLNLSVAWMRDPI
jgi:hypothetical protein